VHGVGLEVFEGEGFAYEIYNIMKRRDYELVIPDIITRI